MTVLLPLAFTIALFGGATLAPLNIWQWLASTGITCVVIDIGCAKGPTSATRKQSNKSVSSRRAFGTVLLMTLVEGVPSRNATAFRKRSCNDCFPPMIAVQGAYDGLIAEKQNDSY